MDAARPSQIAAFPAARRRPLKRLLLLTEWLVWLLFFVCALGFLALRYAVLPNLESYRPQVEATLSKGLGVKVTIGAMTGGWEGLRPDLDLADVRLFDRQGRPALTLPVVSITVSWLSVPFRELRLHALEIGGADLDIRRTAAGKLMIAGIELADQPDGGDMSDWILGQRRIVVADSKLRWNDESRGAPELALSGIRMILENNGDRHQFGLTADPPRELASRIDVRADVEGASLNRLKEWRGRLYADLKYIDLAAWRAWLDYPADVRAGSGSVRAWLGFDGDRLASFTADVGLDNAQARLNPDLPLLELARVSGRISAREIASGGLALGFLTFGAKQVTGFEVSGRQVALTTRAGVTLSPADFSMKTLSARDNKPQEVEIEANSLDLEPLAKIIEHLPLDAQLRKLVTEFNPRGEVFDFRLSWRGEFDQPVGFIMRGRFANLSLEARGPLPGFSNLSGSVEGNEKGGALTLASSQAAIDLPRIFEESRLGLDVLSAQLTWSFPKGRLEVRTDNLVFANPDAAGAAKVLYRTEPGTPGYLDLSARLSRGNGMRTHRYLPQYMKVTRNWAQFALEKAHVDEGQFVLKGNLGDFPFIDPRRGSFRIVLKVSEASLLFANGWPKIDNIKGDVIFDRNTLEVRSIAGGNVGQARLGRVVVRIPDLGARPHMLDVEGVADGSTDAFLKFINDSPVDGLIDGFTETIRASGAGKLALKLTMPIEDPAKLRLAGQFQFINNEIRLDEGLPQLSKVNGTLAFSESGLTLRAIRGEALGGPFSVAGASRSDGVIAINASGNFTVAGLRTWLTDPSLAAASGGSAWRAAINVRKRGGEVTVESNLAGVALDLPAPLGKAAADLLPVMVVKSAVPNTRGEDEFSVTAGRQIAARVQRRLADGEMRFARGAIGVGEPLPALPRSGLALAVNVKSADVDAWQAKLIDARPVAPAGQVSAMPGLATVPAGVAALSPIQASLKAEALDVFGKRLNQVRLNLSQDAATWVAVLASSEANGTLTFRPGGAREPGRLGARLKNLTMPAGAAGRGDETPLDRIAQEMPAVDVTIDAFEVGDKKLGKLDLVANNSAGEWRIQRLNLSNADGVLAGSGAWKARRVGDLRRKLMLDFTLEAYDAGKLLERLGFPGAVRAGSGRLEGAVTWDGSPLAIDYPSLAGNLSVRVEKGQFLKADPGVGKLLGIMSLQALPRRLNLDFRDVFSEGFAFDLVSASSRIDRGVLATTDFKMTGVSAAVLMKGEVDLVRETQALHVVVLPDLSGGMGSVVTALLGNPILGLATYLAQRVLKEPLSKAFSFEYGVSGTWADPKVARVQNQQLGQAPTALPAAPGIPVPGPAPGAMPAIPQQEASR